MPFRFEMLKDTLVSVIRENVEGKDVGVAFSGGLDSGLVAAIAKEYANSVTLYTCGTEKAFDVVMAKDLSEKLGLPWVRAAISKNDIESRICEMIQATGESDPFTISYELQLFSVCKEAKEDIILTGQGADEYFMGCAKFVGQSDYDYRVLKDAAVERLINVSVVCENKIAEHFGKKLVYPYMTESVVREIEAVDSEELRPKDMDSRKSVLREIAIELGHPYIAARKKKSSQYGSGTTDLVRSAAKEKDMMYNQYIESLYDKTTAGIVFNDRIAAVYARINPIVKAEAEMILQKKHILISDVVEQLYKRIIEEDGVDFLKK